VDEPFQTSSVHAKSITTRSTIIALMVAIEGATRIGCACARSLRHDQDADRSHASLDEDDAQGCHWDGIAWVRRQFDTWTTISSKTLTVAEPFAWLAEPRGLTTLGVHQFALQAKLENRFANLAERRCTAIEAG